MGKTRVYQLAKELELSNPELLEKLKLLSIDVKNHMSSLTEEEVEQVRSVYAQKQPAVEIQETRVARGLIRRRRRVQPKPPRAEEVAGPDAEEAAVEAEGETLEAPVSAEPAPAGEDLMGEDTAGETPAAAEAVSPSAEPPTAVPEPPQAEIPGPGEPVEAPEAVERPRAAAEAAAAPRKGKKAAAPQAEEDLEEPEEARKPRKGKRVGGRKVVEYKVRKVRDFATEMEEGSEDLPARRRVDIRRERRPARRAPQKTQITVPKQIKRKIRIGESITVAELSQRMSVKAAEIIGKLMQNRIMATVNQPIDFETASLIATDYGYEVESTLQEESMLLPEEADAPEARVERPPVVTIMGHVNHGKTRLLDAIRQTNVMESEAGGITQHIGAYKVTLDNRTIVFLDTPGHEAFTKMRARGAKVTDIVVLVVASDDGVMPQTVEAVNHAKAAQVPIIVAINKIDLPDANPDRVKQELSEHGLISEEWGGDTLFAPISAKEGTGIQDLLELILLQAEMLELKANPGKKAKGLIIEARLDRTLGTVASVLVQEGCLRVGDPFVTGLYHGKVRALINDRGARIEEAGPSTPVEVLGCSGVPEAGDPFFAVEDERKAKTLSSMRMEKSRKVEQAAQGKMSLEDLYEKIRQDEVKDLNVILKADVQGSAEALAEALERLSNDEVKIRVLHDGVGGVTETDVMLASASDALIIGFNVRAAAKATTVAEQEKVDIRYYSVIYDAVSDVKAAMVGMLKPVYREVLLGHAQVREVFSMHRVGTIAGSYIVDGKMERNAKVRLLRDSIVIYDGRVASLRRFKEDVKEVQAGYECGIRMENYNDIRAGDVLESYFLEQVPHAAEAGIPERRSS